jgi:hypothetical protein
MNEGIKRAAELYSDPKIQYIDIDRTFEGHRFCEPGDSRTAQYNCGDKVHIWNNPAKWLVTITNGADVVEAFD